MSSRFGVIKAVFSDSEISKKRKRSGQSSQFMESSMVVILSLLY